MVCLYNVLTFFYLDVITVNHMEFRLAKARELCSQNVYYLYNDKELSIHVLFRAL